EAEAAAFDLTDDDAVRRFVDTLPDRVGVVVHSAALAKAGASLDLPVDELDRQFATNVRAPWVLNQAIMPRLEAARGQVVFINSGAGLNARRDFSVYCVTKFGLRAYADALREEVNARGIRVISVYPGRVDTPMQDDLLAFEGRTVPKHTLLTPQDVADTTLAALCQAETAEVVDVRVRPRFTS
ncbi:MAG: SDR family NAD(P)-dependent oxidoreductase, partial [Planctomycetota bacterium]